MRDKHIDLSLNPGQLRSLQAKFEFLYVNKYFVFGYEILCVIVHGKQKSNHALIMADLTTLKIFWKDKFDKVFHNFLSKINHLGIRCKKKGEH